MTHRQHGERPGANGKSGRSRYRGTGGDDARRGAVPKRPAGGTSLGRTLALTAASTVVWGLAHLRRGHRRTGMILLTLFLAVTAAMGGAAAYLAGPLTSGRLAQFAFRPGLLALVGTGLLIAALAWPLVIVMSYRVCRPSGRRGRRWATRAGDVAVAMLCLTVAVPLVYTAKLTYVQRDLVTSMFPTSAAAAGAQVPAAGRDEADPWGGRRRFNLLLIGGDSAPGRPGLRTDSMTIASIDTKSADTVLFSLPRNLEDAPIPGRRKEFPRGFQGDGPATPGLLNEIWQFAEDHPRLVPGVPAGDRGPRLLKAVIGEILGLRIDNYVMVNMAGFTHLVDAMGGVRIKVPETILCGRGGRPITPGVRRLMGVDAMWYGRCRTGGSDYTRMSRQKCLLREIAHQADPATVLSRFNRLARAAKRAVATDIPRETLPALVALSFKIKEGAHIRSLQFVPPMIYPGRPDFALIRQKVRAALRESETGNGAAHASAAPPLNAACPS